MRRAVAPTPQEGAPSPATGEEEREVSNVLFHMGGDDEEETSPAPPTMADSAAAAPAGGQARATRELDYEASGQGFVSQRSFRFLPPATLHPAGPAVDERKPSLESQGVSQSQPGGNGLSQIELAVQEAIPEEKAQKPLGVAIDIPASSAEPPAAAAAGSTAPTGTDATSPVPADAIWLLTPAEVAAKYPDSRIDVANPKASQGLTSEQAAAVLARDGRNELKPPPEHSEIVKFLLQVGDPLNILLLIAGLLSAAVAYPVDTSVPVNLYLGIVLFVVVLLNSTFAYVQEGRATNVMKAFKNMLPAQAKVVRDGREVGVAAAELVVGDVLIVGTGDIIPADMRLLWTQDCKVETSSLTGESLPITCAITSPGAAKLEQARNVCFNSSKCLEGESWGVVMATGDRSLIGQIAGLASATKTEATPLQKEINIFVRRLSAGAACLGIIFFVIGMARGQDWLFAFINGFIVVMIACVPQGLPLTVVSCLTIASKRLGAQNVFVKRLQSVETLGSVTVIATDKTGTLTQNKMAVANIWFDSFAHSCASVLQNYPPPRVHRRRGANGKEQSDSYHLGATLEQLELIAALCSKTKFEDERQLTAQEARQLEQAEMLKNMDPTLTLRSARVQYPTLMGQLDPSLTITSGRSKLFADLSSALMDDVARNVIGDASETALFNFVRQRQSVELLRYHHARVYDVPFNSRNKYALTVIKPVALEHESPDRRTLMMKGAPEVVLARCSHYMFRGEVRPIDARFKAEFNDSYERFGSMGQRVLGFASLELPPEQFGAKFDSQYASKSELVPTSGLVFVGLMSLVDPPKETVPQAVLDCHTAGIKVIMVTGDHPLTAAAIARQVNIFQQGCFTRAELAELKQCAPEEVDDEEVDCIVIAGPEIDKFSETDWTRVLSKQNIVFARTTPQQKLQIVEHLQAMGHVVAVTGDGVNDSPALKKADVGVAMGINGSDVARDAAAAILLDDNFASIVVGVREGRTIFDNLTKTVAYTCTHCWPEAIPVLLTLAFSFPLALSSLLILTIDLFTELPPAVSLAYEPSEADVMSRPPRNAKTDRLVTPQAALYVLTQAGIIETLGSLMGFFLVFDYYGMSGSSLFNTPYFQGSGSPDMATFPGCVTLDDVHSSVPHGMACYDNHDQEQILRRAQTCYFVLLTFSQLAHIWLCKTRTASLWTHGAFRNEHTLFGVIVSTCIILLIVFAPSSHTIFTSEPFPQRFWALLPITPVVLALWQEGRKAYVRKYPHSFIAKKVHW